MPNLKHPVPGGSFDNWGEDLNTNDATLGEAVDAANAAATAAQNAANSAAATVSSLQGAVTTATTQAAAAATAASSATSKIGAVQTALNAHASSGDPHPQYLNQARGDQRYVKQAGIGGGSTPSEPVFSASQSAQGLSLGLSFSPFGLRADGSSYYNESGVPAEDRAYPVVQVDGSVRFVKIGSQGTASDLVPPTLSGFASSSVTSVSADVSVTSNETASAVVQYGTTTSYGSQASAVGTGTSFSVPLTGLTAATTYHYRWRVTDLAGNLTVSSDQTFTTAAAGAAPITQGTYSPTSTNIYTGPSLFSGPLSGDDMYVEADVSGLTGADRLAGVVLRSNAGGTVYLRVRMSNIGYKITGVGFTFTDITGSFAGSSSGNCRVEIIGNSVSLYWNGTRVATHDLTGQIAALSGQRYTGLTVFTDTAGGVTISNGKTQAISGGTAPPATGGSTPGVGQPGYKAQQMFGATRSGLPWHSGAWVTSTMSTANANGFGSWRGAPLDFYTVYPAYSTWNDMNTSEWVEQLTSGFAGRLNFGLPMLPGNRAGAWGDVNNGTYDYVFTKLANDLKNANRGDSVIRVGLECNRNWFPWSVTWNTNTQFISAYQRIVNLFRAVSPNFKFAYCWTVYTLPQGMPSGTSPQAQLDRFYPGDAYVDLIELDFYDFWNVQVRNETEWSYAKNPLPGVGLDAIVAYARAHNKGVWFGEWGCHSVQGSGDNTFFMTKVWEYFVSIADVLVGENYFNEPASYIANGIGYPTNQLPNAATRYKNRLGRPDL